MDLKCRKLTCKHNKEYSCTKKGILVTQSCLCQDFEKATDLPPEQKQDVSKDMFKKVPKIHPYRHNKDMCIQCKAPCIFNNDTICKANGITVLDWKNSPLCGTFMKK